MLFASLFVFIVAQRLFELGLAHKNSLWLKGQGAYEVGADHYKYIVMLHLSFFLSLVAEVNLLDSEPAWWFWFPLLFFVLVQIMRFWVMYSLGRFWNTRIFILPGETAIKKGPYRFIRHPNYVVVALEIMVFPLIFQAYYTAFLFSFANALLLLIVRIPEEEKALQEATNYHELYLKKN